MNYKDEIPDSCPECGESDFEVFGVQFCNGALIEKKADCVAVDLEGSEYNWDVTPLKVTCSNCDKVLFTDTVKLKGKEI